MTPIRIAITALGSMPVSPPITAPPTNSWMTPPSTIVYRMTKITTRWAPFPNRSMKYSL